MSNKRVGQMKVEKLTKNAQVPMFFNGMIKWKVSENIDIGYGTST